MVGILSVVGILVKGFIDLSGKGLSLLPTSVLTGKGLSLSPPQNPEAILIENRDVYMINPCSANISFVVELCETIVVQSLEVGCLELFSSIPKSFRVYSSDR